MTVLSPAEIAGYAKAAGFSGANLAWAVAVALAESGGDPKAFNGRGADQSYGLWQINMKGALGPDRRSKYGLTSNEQLFDPATNARVAFALSSSGGNWKPWTTFVSGKAAAKLDVAKSGVSNPSTPMVSVDTAGFDVATPVGNTFIPDWLEGIGNALTSKEFWRRVMFFGAGGAILILAWVLLLREPATKLVQQVSPLGAVTKGLSK